jgi:alpha-glucosidase
MEIKTKEKKHLRHQGLGRLLSYKVTANGLSAVTENGYLKLTAYSKNIVRVQISESDLFDELSYAVVAEPGQVDVDITENDASIIIETKGLRLDLERDPVRVSFYNQSGQLLNQDYPGFGISFMGSTKSVYKTLQKGERFIGLGEKTGNLDRRGTGYTNHNTDAFAYGPETDPLYCTFPFYIGLHHQLAYGVFLDNTYQSHFNFGASNDRFSSFTVEGGDLNYYFISGNSVAEIIGSYSFLTGLMPLPPLWGLGYQQCRYSYYPEHEVANIAQTFREKRIPADAIVLDIHYMDRYKIFSWDAKRYPNPKKMIEQLKSMGFNVVVMCDPGIKIEEDYHAYQDGIAQDLFLKYPDGTYYSGQVWPGWCHFPDFTNSMVRQWWGEKLEYYTEQGINGYWNDMNEIATWGQKLPELIEFHFEGEGGSAKRGRNVYGHMMSRSTYEGVRKSLPDQRPFNLTRAAYCGVQRYAAVWTGDNVSNDEHMLLGVRLVNSLGLVGVAYTGYDVGGFVGDASTHLFARWISIGAFSPFFRGHSMINSKDSEPWSYGEEVEDISRNYINLRYQLLPYIYSVFHEAATSGIPVSRSLAIDHAFDDQIYQPSFQNQYLFGPNILVAPVESYKDLTKVYLPHGAWYNFHTEAFHAGQTEVFVECPISHLPLFIRAGAILPMQSTVQSTQEVPDSLLHLHMYAGADGSFDYYEDDGNSYQYQEGQYYQRQFKYHHQSGSFTMGKVEGSYQSRFQKVKCYLHGFQDLQEVMIKGQQTPVEQEELVFLPAVSSFDPLGKENISFPVGVQTFTFKNSDLEIEIVVGSRQSEHT